jgi:hypothetical protein
MGRALKVLRRRGQELKSRFDASLRRHIAYKLIAFPRVASKRAFLLVIGPVGAALVLVGG